MPLKAKQIGGVGVGRLLFGSASGFLADDAELVWDTTNNRLGILVALPLFPLHVNGQSLLGGAASVGASAQTILAGSLGIATLKAQVAATEAASTLVILLVDSTGAPLFAVDAAGRVLAGSGALANCGLSFGADPDTGLYLPATGELGIVLAGAERARYRATGVQELNVISAPSSNVASGGERYAESGASWYRSQNGLLTCLGGAGTERTDHTTISADSDEATSTDGTPFVLQSLKLPESCTASITWEVVGYQTGGAVGAVGDAFGGTRQVRAGRKGTDDARVIGSHTLGVDDAAEIVGPVISFDVSGTNVEIIVTPVVSRNISWSASFRASVISCPP